MKRAIKLLKYAKSGKITDMSISDYNTVVACLMYRLTQENGARPSTLIGLTLEVLGKFEMYEDEIGCQIVKLPVFEHKTGDRQVAILTLTPEMLSMLVSFRRHVRPMVPGESSHSRLVAATSGPSVINLHS